MTPNYKILRSNVSLAALERAIQAEEDYEPINAPFRDESMGEWCIGMKLRGAPMNGEIRLKEPKKR